MPTLRGYKPATSQLIPPDASLQIWINDERVSFDNSSSVRRSIFKHLRQDEIQYRAFSRMFPSHVKIMQRGQKYAVIFSHDKPMIIHVAGAPGSGKTFLGERLKKEFGDDILVKDIDDLRADFIKSQYKGAKFEEFDKKAFQTFINDFIKANQFAPLIFVGLNVMPWWHKDHFYNLHATNNFYLTVDNATLLQRKCRRLLTSLANSEADMDFLVQNNSKYIANVTAALRDECSLEKTIHESDTLSKSFKDQGYTLMAPDEVFRQITQLVSMNLE